MKRKEDGDTRSIGVANFHAEHLSNIIDLSFFTPGDQPDRAAPAAESGRAARGERRATASSPRPTARWASAGCWTTRPSPSVAQAHDKTPAQVLIRWSIQLGNVVIPRSANPERIKSNIEVFDFELTRRRDGHAQRARRRHPIPAGPRHLHGHLTGFRPAEIRVHTYSIQRACVPTRLLTRTPRRDRRRVRAVARWLGARVRIGRT